MNRMVFGPDESSAQAEVEVGGGKIRGGAEIRLGMVNYINTAPIYEPWKERPEIRDAPVRNLLPIGL